MSDDAELTEEDIRFNAHALLRSLFGRIDHIRQDKKWAELENSDIAHHVETMSMDIEDYFACMGIEP